MCIEIVVSLQCEKAVTRTHITHNINQLNLAIMAYKLTREKAFAFLFETLTAADLENLSKNSESYKESENTVRLRKELNASLLHDYRANTTGKFAVGCMRKAINTYCKTHKGFCAEHAINAAISKDGVNAVVDTVDRFARLFIDSVNGSMEKETEKTVSTFKVSDAKKLYYICGSLSKTAEYFGVPKKVMFNSLKASGVKVEYPTTEDKTK